MSSEGRPTSEKSRQELLDEIYYLRDVAGEREQQIRRLQAGGTEAGARAIAELDRILHSRSWRWTAPLRWLARLVRRARATESRTTAAQVQLDSQSRNPDSGADPQPPWPQPAPPVLAEDRGDGKPRLYVDVTELALRHGRTGVQRVTREILRALLAAPPTGYIVQPAYAPPGQSYRCAHEMLFPSGEGGRIQVNSPPPSGEGGRRPGGGPDTRDVHSARNPVTFEPLSRDVLLRVMPGDIFLGLDHAMDAVIANAGQLAAMHEQGVRLWFVCNDVLPLVRPDWFPSDVPPKFRVWLATIARVADGIACISRATESELRQQLDEPASSRSHPPTLVHFHLGADAAMDSERVTEMPSDQATFIERLRGTTSFLMVGTLEPRKGHAQALEAFNQLWAEGENLVLVLAGLPGWMTEVTQRRIRHHDEFGQRLFWFADASDAMLDKLYGSCTALLACSEGEGFGLPLIEAARHGLPILCRDLPVFREVAGDHATYFSGRDSASLADAIRGWREAFRVGAAPASGEIRLLTWMESSRELMNVVLNDHAERVIAGR